MIKVMFLIILPTMVFSQINISPLDIPLNLSGTFGELRSTHFHTGIDIKTGGKQGLKVRSIKKGQVVRVRVSRGGYGKSIYIKHYDGTTSVYAHLKKFSKKVEDYVKKIQYKNKTYEMQSFPKEGQLNFDLGELIGFSGNTGGTSGPHLHFEIRDSNNNPLNPFELDFEITDTIKPVISGLYLYKVYDDGKYDFIKKIKIKKINNSLYAASKIKNTGRLGIGLKYYDRQDKSYSKNGVYSINFNLNADSIFNYKVDQLNFNDRKYLKLLIDHKKWNKERVRVQKLFTHPKSKYSFINKRKSYGVFTISDGLSYDGEIKVIDFKGNQTKIKLNFEGIIKDSIQNISKSGNINPDKEYTIDLKNISIKIPKNSFYNSIDIKINSNNDTLDLGENIHLINKGFEIKYQVSKTDSVFFKKGFISKINKYGNARYLKTKKEISNLSKPIIGKDLEIFNNSIIDNGAIIGDNFSINNFSSIGHNCSIGNNVKIGKNVSISNSIIGDNVTIGDGTKIGQSGFGFTYDANNDPLKIFHIGRVIIQNNVNINSNCTIDRGSFNDTVIGENTFIDNLVHIAHNVTIGNNCMIAGQCGFAGSAKIGNFVQIGGQTGIGGHIKISDYVKIAAKSGVIRDIPKNETVMGYPAINLNKYLKNYRKNMM